MKSELSRTTQALGAIVFGITLLVSGLRLGTDAELEVIHRAVAAGVLTPAGVLLLVTSHRAMRNESTVRPVRGATGTDPSMTTTLRRRT